MIDIDEAAVVSRTNIFLEEFDFEASLPCRIERALRRKIFQQRNPDCSTLKWLCGFPRPRNGLGHITLGTPKGNRILYFRTGTSDRSVIRQIFGSWDYDFSNFRRWPELRGILAARFLEHRRPLIIDAGANIGASAVYFATVFPTATIVTLEPEISNFNLLVKNTEGLPLTNLNGALASEPGMVTVTNPGTEHWSFQTERVESSGDVPCFAVNDLYNKYVGGDVFPYIVKIDIEGGEKDVFMQNTEWVARTPIIIIELHDWKWSRQGTSHSFLKCISALDRDFIYTGENIFSIDNNL